MLRYHLPGYHLWNTFDNFYGIFKTCHFSLCIFFIQWKCIKEQSINNTKCANDMAICVKVSSPRTSEDKVLYRKYNGIRTQTTLVLRINIVCFVSAWFIMVHLKDFSPLLHVYQTDWFEICFGLSATSVNYSVECSEHSDQTEKVTFEERKATWRKCEILWNLAALNYTGRSHPFAFEIWFTYGTRYELGVRVWRASVCTCRALKSHSDGNLVRMCCSRFWWCRTGKWQFN